MEHNELKSKLEAELIDRLIWLREDCDVEEKEHKIKFNEFVTMYKLLLDTDKTETECSTRYLGCDVENEKLKIESDKIEIEREKLDVEREKNKPNINDTIAKYIDVGGKILVPLIQVASTVAMTKLSYSFYQHWLTEGMKFEETGTFTSKTFQGLTRKFEPKK